MHFYLLRGVDTQGKCVSRKIIAADDAAAQKKCQNTFPDISVNELLDCEPISWGSPASTRLPKGCYYLVLGKHLTYNPTRSYVDVEEKINAGFDDAAARRVSVMYANHEIEDARLLRCRIVERKN